MGLTGPKKWKKGKTIGATVATCKKRKANSNEAKDPPPPFALPHPRTEQWRAAPNTTSDAPMLRLLLWLLLLMRLRWAAAAHAPRRAGAPRCVPFGVLPHDVMLTERSLPLGPNATGAPRPSREARLAVWQRDAEDARGLQGHLGGLARAHCGDLRRQLITDNVGYGFGSVVNSFVKPYTHAVWHGLTLWSSPLGTYRDQATVLRCATDSFACWQRPWSACEALAGAPAARAVPRMIAENRSLKAYSLMHVGNDADGFPRTVPPPWRRKGHFWFVAQLLARMLLRPNARLAALLAQTKARMRWAEAPLPVLSLHVRRGDACNAEQQASKKRRCDDLAGYMPAVEGLAQRFGFRSVFLATDDDEVVAATRAFPQFTWLVVPGLDRGATKKLKWEANLRSHDFDNFAEGQAALVDLLLMAEASGFVGKFTSNLDRIAYALMAARAGCYPPFHSLDSSWCSDLGRAAGRSTHGTFFC